jgi:2-C-methyl-D-erythritol 4-phosphate cytidylyltransferase
MSTLLPCSFDPSPHGPPRCYALIPCAGTGSRAGAAGPKQYQRLAGQRVIDHTVAAFVAVPTLAGIGVVLAPGDTLYHSPSERVRAWHVGGATRAHSVFYGLQALAGAGARAQDWVLVHDAARCLIAPADIEGLMRACAHDPVGGLLALPLPDTLKQSRPDGPQQARVVATVARHDKWLAQTPQMFRWQVLYEALAVHEASGFAGITDEASAVEAAGHSPLLVPGSSRNLKVTYPDDFAVAQALLSSGAFSESPPCHHP